MTRLKFIDIEMRDRDSYVLLLAFGVSEAKINEFDFVVFCHFQDFCGRHCHVNLLNMKGIAILNCATCSGSVARSFPRRSNIMMYR
jgi:hypothetical protein